MAQISQDDYLNDTSQFDLARKRAKDQSDVDLQARKDALQRRFASLGNLDSGAQLKQEELAVNDASSNLTNANEGINAQQQAEIGRRKEVIQGQNFQTSEREAGQNFVSGEATKQRDYGTSERLASEKYGTSERVSGQDFASSEANKQRDTQIDQFNKTYGLSNDQFKEAQKQFSKTFAEEQRVNDANIRFAESVLGQKGTLDTLISNPLDFAKKYTATGKIYGTVQDVAKKIVPW